MDDEPGMRILDGVHDLPHEFEPHVDVRAVLAAPLRDRHAIDIFQREIRPAVGGEARVIERGDVRMVEACEDVALTAEAFAHRARKKVDVRQLEGHVAVELAVGALREPDHTHSAGSNFAHEPIDADSRARLHIVVGCTVDARALEIFRRGRAVRVAQHAPQPGAGLGIARLLRGQPVRRADARAPASARAEANPRSRAEHLPQQ